jgi:hypothetical protein
MANLFSLKACDKKHLESKNSSALSQHTFYNWNKISERAL